MKWLLYLFPVFLLSCSSHNGLPFTDDLPNEEMALKKVKAEMNDVTIACIEIIDFKKTDGVKQNVFGQDMYRMSYTVKYRFKQNAHQPFLNHGSLYYYDDKEYKIGLKHMNSPGDYYHFKKGEELQKNDAIMFEKTENGWQ